jgi:hypothetical protein
VKRIYVAVLDPTNVGEINRLLEEPCGKETGVEIQIPVRPQDIWDFDRKARDLFSYFTPTPSINTNLTTRERTVTKHGFLSPCNSNWIALMGCIPYRINISQIQKELEEYNVSFVTLREQGGALFFNIGDVQVSANREELKYTESTKKALGQKFLLLQEAYVQSLLSTLEDKKLSEWERRVKVCQMVHRLRLPLPDSYKEYTRTAISLIQKDSPPRTKFQIVLNKSVFIDDRTRFVLLDDPRAISGFSFEDYHFLIKPLEGATQDEVLTELEPFLERAKLTGVPIVLASSFYWSSVDARRVGNKKHQVNTFRLKTQTSYFPPYSEGWEIENREPQEDDVFVILEKFIARIPYNFYSIYSSDVLLAKEFKLTMPQVYGYKHTTKDPKVTGSIKGTCYFEWRKTFFGSLLTEDKKEALQQLRWSRIVPVKTYDYRTMASHPSKYVAQVAESLGLTHPISAFLSQVLKAKEIQKITPTPDTYEKLLQVLQTPLVYEAETKLHLLEQTYPLLNLYGGLNVLGGKTADVWIEYIKLVDRDHLVTSRSSDSEKAKEKMP